MRYLPLSIASLASASLVAAQTPSSSSSSISDYPNPGTTLIGQSIWHHGSSVGSSGSGTATGVTITSTAASTGTASFSSYTSIATGSHSSGGSSSGSSHSQSQTTSSSPAATSFNAGVGRQVGNGFVVAGFVAGLLV